MFSLTCKAPLFGFVEIVEVSSMDLMGIQCAVILSDGKY